MRLQKEASRSSGHPGSLSVAGGQSDREFLEVVEAVEEKPGTASQPVATPSSPPPLAATPSVAAESREAVSPERSAAISEEEVREFVEDYLKAAEGPRPAGEVAFFSEKVDYFDSGKVSRQFIEKDQRNYYRRWRCGFGSQSA